MSPNRISRRAILRHAALVVGAAAVSPQLVAAVLDDTPGPSTSAFSSSQREIISDLCDVILPSTQTPGAVEAGVPDYISALVSRSFAQSHKDSFVAGLDAFSAWIKDESAKGFSELSRREKTALVTKIDSDVFAGEGKLPPADFYREFKGLVVVGYYTSEIGATQELSYEAVPGRYEPCIPYEEIGSAWAT